MRPVPSLADAFDPRANSLSALRLLLATTVAAVHAGAVAFGRQPHLGSAEVGALAVDAFFVISGFLVTRSLLRLSTPRYLWHRALRILPGFWACLVVTAVVVAPAIAVLEGRPVLAVLVDGPDSAVRYVTDNAALLITQYDIAGLPRSTATPGVVDGSLWTLFYEAVCYVLLAAGGLVTLRHGIRWPVPVTAAALWATTLAASSGLLHVPTERLLRFTFLFVTASAAALYAREVPVRGRLALLCGAVTLTALFTLPHHRPVAGPAFVYLVLYAVVRLPLRRGPRADLSYGIYVYHWPVHVLLTLLGATAWGVVPFVAVALAVTAAVATLSWHHVEAPALHHKDWDPPWRRRDPRPGRRERAPVAVR